MTQVEIAEILDVGRTTLYRHLMRAADQSAVYAGTK